MYGLDIPERIIQSAICASHVQGDTPLSINIVGRAGIGKTQTLLQFTKNKSIIETSDISQKNLKSHNGTLKREIQLNGLKHIIIPDFIMIMGHKYETVYATITTLNALIEEGLRRSDFYSQESSLDTPLFLGVLTSMTFSKFEELFVRFYTTGFFSRFINVSWAYSDTTNGQIRERINQQMNDHKTIDLSRYTSKTFVFDKRPSTMISKRMDVMTDKLLRQQRDFYVSSSHSGYVKTYSLEEGSGNRLSKQLWKLVKGIAISEHPDECVIHDHDMDILDSFLPYVGFKRQEDVIRV